MDFDPNDIAELTGLSPDYLDNLETLGSPQDNVIEQKQIEHTRREVKVRDEETPVFNTLALYQQGLDRLLESGYLLVPNPESKLAGHNVYTSQEPEPIRGINYPQGLRTWVRLTSPDTLANLYTMVSNWGNANPGTKIFTKSLQPQLKQSEQSPLQALATLMHRLETERYRAGDHTFELRQNPGCEGMPFARNQPTDTLDGACRPIALLPPVEWFDESVRQLKLEDIITILPPEELSMFSLAFGRGLVGRSGHVPPGSDTPVKHYARMGLLIQGSAGIGKSGTLDRGLLRVLKKVGYNVSTSYDLEGKYNDMEVFQSNIAYLDDTNIQQLTKLASSHITKMVITNSTVKYEQKYIPAGVIPCHTFICVCLNEIDEYVVFKMDEGNADRLKLVTCYTKPQMDTEPLVVLGKTYPTRSPDLFIPELASDLGVDPDAIWLWACRLMADDFYHHAQNDLANEVKLRTLALRFSWMKNVVPGIMGLYYLTHLVSLMERNDGVIPNALKEVSLDQIKAVDATTNLSKVLDSSDVLYSLLEHYQENPFEDHPYQWLSRLHPHSIATAITLANECSQSQTTAKPWEQALAGLELKSGFSFKPGHHRIVQGWQRAVNEHDLYLPIANSVYTVVKREMKKRILTGLIPAGSNFFKSAME